MSNRKFTSDNFVEICERIKKELSVSKDKELIEFIETTQPTFSRRKNEDNFSIEWAYLISIKTGLRMLWILTGNGPKKLDDPRSVTKNTSKKYEILNDAEEWLDEKVRKNPDRKAWFELHLLDSFPEFKEWRRKRDEEKSIEDEGASRKVA